MRELPGRFQGGEIGTGGAIYGVGSVTQSSQ